VAGQKFREDEKEKKSPRGWVSRRRDSIDIGIQKLVPRLNKYLDKGGDYVDK